MYDNRIIGGSFLHELLQHTKAEAKKYPYLLRHVQYHNHRFMENLPVKPDFIPGRAAPVLNVPGAAQSGQSLNPEWHIDYQNSRS
jgi:hypothetical protein